MRTLYLCYFGLREPLVQTQVLPYLRQLVAGGVGVSLLTFEPDREWAAGERDEWRARLAAEGIDWHWRVYHRRGGLPAKLYDIATGARAAIALQRSAGIDVFHARSHVAAAMGAIAKRRTGARLIFDIRGFMPEEYVDAGVWPAGGYLYRLTKRAERSLLAASDGFVVLTEKARGILFSRAERRPVEVIPCCVDRSRFERAESISRAEARRALGVEGRRVLIYVGALDGWYLTDELAAFIAQAHERDDSTYTIVVTQSRPEAIEGRLRRLGVAGENYRVLTARPEEVPRYLRAADLAISMIKPCYSKLASSPTKIAEYLAAGLPVVSNAGIGDLDEMIEGDRVGVIVRELDRAGYGEALRRAEELLAEADLAARCRASAARRFDLEGVGGARYLRLYERLGANVRMQPERSMV
jgi:glycosyltransferase involved in cell wall biosynthesis